jgi:hypothetical protein
LAPKKDGSNNLTPEDIELREDGVAQKIEVFQGGERYPQTIPVEINLLFDNVSHGEPVKPVWMNSWKIDMGAIDSRGIASISVWGLGQGLIRLTPPTRDPAMLSRAMDRVWDIWSAPYRSEARMLSVIAAVAGTAAQGRTNVVRMITVVTRGCNVEQDDDTARAVGELGTPIFPLLVRDIEAQTPDFFSRSATMAVARCDDKGVLTSVATKSGGRAISINPMQNFDRMFENVTQALRDQVQYGYVAGFYAPSGERKSHKIQVVLKDSSHGKLTGNARTIVH